MCWRVVFLMCAQIEMPKLQLEVERLQDMQAQAHAEATRNREAMIHMSQVLCTGVIVSTAVSVLLYARRCC